MDRAELVRILAPMMMIYNQKVPEPVWTTYHKALQDVPTPLLEAAVDAAMRRDDRFVPKPGELLRMAEQCRQALLASHPYDGCAECEMQKGWRTIISEKGVRTVEPCPCRERYKMKLARLGAGNEPLALLEAESVEA